MSFDRNYYFVVVVDDYSPCTMTLFLSHKRDTFTTFQKLAKVIYNKKGLNFAPIRSGKFQNVELKKFCNANEIEHHFLLHELPKKYISGKEKWTLDELAGMMLNETNLLKYFWSDAVCNVCYMINCVLVRQILNHTSYELYKGRKSNISHLHYMSSYAIALYLIAENNLSYFHTFKPWRS